VASRILAGHGHQVLTAVDGRKALDIYREKSAEIDVVLLDLTMPGLGGAETMAEMRRIDPAARIVLSSGYDEEDLTTRLGEARPAGFLPKPYRLGDLLRKVAEAVARTT
jgi:CheY-like chemotaxis protein